MADGLWMAEAVMNERRAWLVTPNGFRVALMTRARALGIAAALNTEQGRAAFEAARNA